MQLQIDLQTLTRALHRVQGVVERRQTNAALAHVHLLARGERLRVTATDTQITLTADYPATVQREGELCADAAHLFQIIKSLPDSTVSLSVTGGSRLQVRSGKALFNLNTLAANDYPPVDQGEPKKVLRLPAATLARLIEETAFSVSADDNRYGLNGAYLERVTAPDGTPRVRMVSTDGSRLSYSEAPFEGEVGMGKKVLLPRKALSEIKKLIGGAEPDQPWELGFSDRAAVLRREGVRFLARLVEGEFPDYKEVLPEHFRRRVEIRRVPFLDALRRVSLVATDRNHSSRFTFDRTALTISADNLDMGDAREEIDATLEGDGFATGFNIRYFQDLLGPTSGESLTLEMGDVLDPCIVRLSGRDDCLFVVMPMRLD